MLEPTNEPNGSNNSVSEQTGLMAECLGMENQPDEPKETAPSTANGSHDSGTSNDGSNPNQVQPTTEEPSVGKWLFGEVTRWNSPLRHGHTTRMYIGIIVVVLFFIVVVLVLSLLKSQACPSCPSCPEDWIMWRGKCYHFSDAEGTWNSSQNNCTLHGASLFVPGPEKEMPFIRHFVGNTEHWIGLWREEEQQPWKLPNGSVFNNLFEIGANGPCAYLDKQTAGSTWCDTERNWICAKSLPTV